MVADEALRSNETEAVQTAVARKSRGDIAAENYNDGEMEGTANVEGVGAKVGDQGRRVNPPRREEEPESKKPKLNLSEGENKV